MSTESNPSPFFEWPTMMANAMQHYVSMFAPNALNQPILPGWDIGNTYYVTEQNSSAPGTEKAILESNSYGRQIGKIMDALTEMIAQQYQDAADRPKSLQDLMDMHDEIEKIKIRQVKIRLGQIKKDLELLSEKDQHAYQSFLKRLP